MMGQKFSELIKMGEAIEDRLKSGKVTSLTALQAANKSSPSMAAGFARKRKRMSPLYLLAQGQGHKGILGLVLPSETPTNSPPLIITNHLHKLHFQSTMHNRTTNHHHRTTKHHHLSTKINHQLIKIHHQITKPMYQPTKVLDKITQIPIIYPALT